MHSIIRDERGRLVPLVRTKGLEGAFSRAQPRTEQTDCVCSRASEVMARDVAMDDSVAPDAGRAKHAVRFAEMIEADFAIMHKTRPAHDVVSVTEVTGRVRDKVAIIGDDITTTGSTLIAGAQALKAHGAKEVWVFVTHALLSAEGSKRLSEADIAGIVVTDTVPIDPITKPEHMTVLTVAPLLAETIMNVFADDSVSAIFGGENQLF